MVPTQTRWWHHATIAAPRIGLWLNHSHSSTQVVTQIFHFGLAAQEARPFLVYTTRGHLKQVTAILIQGQTTRCAD